VPLQPGPNPSPQALRKAYRLAVMRFHPDRQRHSSLAERVKAEEAFKVISQKSEAYHA
jgi:curved DNA-binding protein CbpA